MVRFAVVRVLGGYKSEQNWAPVPEAEWEQMGVIILISIVVESAVPALIPLLRKCSVTANYWKAMALFAVSALLQAAFTIGVAKQLITLSYSLRFAMIGIPSCILSVLLFAMKGEDNTLIAIASPSIGVIIWLFFITAH